MVGTENETALYSNELVATEWRRIGTTPTLPLEANAKIRYRQADQEAIISYYENNNTMKISFKEPQRALASGQIVAVYQ